MRTAAVALLLSLALPLAAQPPPTPPEGEKVLLDPYKVTGEAISNFAVSVRIVKDAHTNKIVQIVITGVAPDSDAEKLGLRVDDEILTIDGRPVAGMDGKIDRNSEIGLLLLNRRPGTPLEIEVSERRTQKVTLHAAPLP